ncbi:GNAT family N-acetyltransferase [Mesorhizobium sp. NPDC059054]|uniref:GNAT family N-acetyltransferase n=1 Tax=Mesorhizobium sp. NPDC059054 TaxID=3346711 RepID=UPI0036C31B4B
MVQEHSKLRRATGSDLRAIVALTEQAYAPYTQMLDAPPVPVTEDYAPRIEAGEVWLLELSGTLAGLIVLERHSDHIWIFSVAVAPEFQGKKLGIRLLDWAEEKAGEAGVDLVKLYTNARMERNIALYSAYGYRETGRRANPKRPGWTVVDMEKQLAG